MDAVVRIELVLHKKQLRLVDLLRYSQEKVILPGKFDWGIKVTHPSTQKLRSIIAKHCSHHVKPHQIDLVIKHVDDGHGHLDFKKLVDISKAARGRNRLQDHQARAATVVRTDPTSDILHCNSSTVREFVTSKNGDDRKFASQFAATNPGEINVTWDGSDSRGLGNLLPSLQILHSALTYKRLDLGEVCGLKNQLWQNQWELRGMKTSNVCKQHGAKRQNGLKRTQYGAMGQTAATAWRANGSFCGEQISTEQVEAKQTPQSISIHVFVRSINKLKTGLSLRTLADIAKYFTDHSGEVNISAVHRSMSQIKQNTKNDAQRRSLKRNKKRAQKAKQSASYVPVYRGVPTSSRLANQHIAWGEGELDTWRG
jgi:hypothetical protein